MELREALDAHLLRLGVLSLLCLLAGVACSGLASEARRGYAVMTAGWSAINLLIVLGSLFRRNLPERPEFLSFLTLNLWLNVGYMAIGGLMIFRSSKPFVRGMGAAVITQGLLLLVLDGWLYLQVRG